MKTDYATPATPDLFREELSKLVEVYHRELKQTCGIERCQARTGRSQRNHICLAILAWLDKFRRRLVENISFYQQDWDVIKMGIPQHIALLVKHC